MGGGARGSVLAQVSMAVINYQNPLLRDRPASRPVPPCVPLILALCLLLLVAFVLWCALGSLPESGLFVAALLIVASAAIGWVIGALAEVLFDSSAISKAAEDQRTVHLRARRIALKAGLATLMGIASAAMIRAAVHDPRDPFDDTRFSQVAWLSARRTERARMVRDILNTQLLAGKTESQVVAVLGKPDEVLDKSSDDDWFTMRGEGLYAYSLGVGGGFLSVQDHALVVHFDAAGRVIVVKID